MRLLALLVLLSLLPPLLAAGQDIAEPDFEQAREAVERGRILPLAEVLARLSAHDVPASAILTVTEAIAAPQTVARGLLRTVPGGQAGDVLMTQPARFSEMDCAALCAAPGLGADGPAILSARLGLDAAAIGALQSAGVLVVPGVPKGEIRHD